MNNSIIKLLIIFISIFERSRTQARINFIIIGESSNNELIHTLIERINSYELASVHHVNDYVKNTITINKRIKDDDVLEEFQAKVAGNNPTLSKRNNFSSKRRTDSKIIMMDKGFYEMNPVEQTDLYEFVALMSTNFIILGLGATRIPIERLTTKCFRSDYELNLREQNHIYLCNAENTDNNSMVIGLRNSPFTSRKSRGEIKGKKLHTTKFSRFFALASSAHRNSHHSLSEEQRDSTHERHRHHDNPKHHYHRHQNHAKLTLGEKNVLCKYRKSCYETNVLPTSIKNIPKQESIEGKPVAETVYEVRTLCKYRKSCYMRHLNTVNVQTKTTQQQHHDGDDKLVEMLAEMSVPPKPKILVKQKHVFHHKSKRTVKDLAAKILNRKAIKQKVMKLRQVENHTGNAALTKEKRNLCKYRKSCYTTGRLNIEDIQTGAFASTLMNVLKIGNLFDETTTAMAGMDSSQALNDLTFLQKQLYCKYRKSCYETGERPTITDTWQSQFTQTTDVAANDGRRTTEASNAFVPLKVKCKYRRSCYETGEIPIITDKLAFVHRDNGDEEVKERMYKRSSMPTTMKDLKTYCKFRISCYHLHATTSIDMVNNEDVGDYRTIEVRSKAEASMETNNNEDLVGRGIKKEKISPSPKPNVKSITKKSIVAKKTRVDDMTTYVNGEKKPSDELGLATDEENTIKQKSKKRGRDIEVSTTAKKVMKQPHMKPLKTKEIVIAETESISHTIEEDDTKTSTHAKSTETHMRRDKVKTKREKPNSSPKQTQDKSDKTSNKGIIPDSIEKSQKPVEINQKLYRSGQIRSDEVLRENPNAKIHLECKYRKSCYEMGEKGYGKPQLSIVEISELKNTQLDRLPIKTKCKYRKSCYETGILPKLDKKIFSLSNLIDEIEELEMTKRKEDKKLKCKFRKSCYATTGKIYTTQAHKPTDDVQNYEKNVSRLLGTILEKESKIIDIRDLKRPNGEPCKIYYTSCRIQAGLPIKEKAPIGPNGERLCRKKKKE